MTALNIIRQSSAVHILTDGAGYRPDGAMAFAMPKVFPLANLDAAVAGRGSPLFLVNFAIAATIKSGSFDRFKAIAIDLASAVFREVKAAMIASGEGSLFDLAVAGWSEAGGPSAYFITNNESYGATVPPWQIVESGPINLAPQNAAISAELEREFPNGADPDLFDPEVDGLRILEIQRRHPVTHSSGSAFADAKSVGAFAQLTTIRRGEITMKIIRRWPDEIGQPIARGR